MSIFGKLKSEGLEESQDRLGGYAAKETDIYTGKIKMAYAGKAKSGAQSVTIIQDQGGTEYRETIYVTNKAGENWFLNKDDKSKKVPLPGFTIMDDICMVTVGCGLAEIETEEKMVKIYDPDQKKELPKAVHVLTPLIGQEVSLGIRKVLENKSKKEGDEYVPTSEERTSNVIEKVFHTETKMTVAEGRQGLDAGVFWDAWLEKNKGQVQDKRTIKDGVQGAPIAGRVGTGAPPKAANQGSAPAAAQARKSLFGAAKAP